jgi:RsiW-degrading membrane proteinase PrsW (M82 family)
MSWHFASTAPASLLVGIICTALLLLFRRQRDETGKTSPQKIVASFLFGISVYTLIVLVVGHFASNTMIRMIDEGFGETRVAWLFVGLAADGFARLYRVFDP